MIRLIVFLLILTLSVSAENLESWMDKQKANSLRKLLGSLGLNGSVVAAPTEHTPGQNYYFFWVRDGALVMSELAAQSKPQQYLGLLNNYINFCHQVQNSPQPAEPGFTGLGEPKFFMDGKVFQSTSKWASPQDDGPPLRVLSLLDCLKCGAGSKPDVEAMVSRDIDYICRTAGSTKAVDLWEEVRGRHYFTQLAQFRALEEYGRLKGDSSAIQQAKALLAKELQLHHQDGWIRSNLEDLTRLDISVVLAEIYLQRGPEHGVRLLDSDLMATFWRLRQAFLSEYPINQSLIRDLDNQLMEPGLGRYPGDLYDGSEVTPQTRANPWFLATCAGAEYCGRLAKVLSSPNVPLNVDEKNRPLLELAVGQPLKAGPLPGQQRPKVVAGLNKLARGYLRRVRRHCGADGAMSEQFNRQTGIMTGATSLTWNYAAYLRAQRVMAKLSPP